MDDMLLIKVHFFLFFAALGPILPFLFVTGKQLGISDMAMGFIFSIIPVFYFVSKSLYGFVLDYYTRQRTFIFTITIAMMGLFYSLIYFVPNTLQNKEFTSNISCSSVSFCDLHKYSLPESNISQICNLLCTNGIEETQVELRILSEHCNHTDNIISVCNISQASCQIQCKYVNPVSSLPMNMLYNRIEFWIFIILMTLGLVSFNIISSASDAICLNALGEGNEAQYGNQRLWGTVGYGITAFLAGYFIDYVSEGSFVKNNFPAFMILILCVCLDIIVCVKLKFSSLPHSNRILKDTLHILKKPHIMIFVSFTLFVGIFDGFCVNFLFWFMEDLAVETGLYQKIRLIQGMIVFVQSFFGELLIFFLSGKIIERIGYGNSFTLCFIFFSIRFHLLSFIPNPWWALPCEAIFHGLTYAFSYCTIVGYVGFISTCKIQGTMQGMVLGIYDGFGYALGCLIGGMLCSILSLRNIFRFFGSVALIFDKKVAYIAPKDSTKEVFSDSE
ncbi:hypothetical protein PGB90_000822 [Kerria lacca]